MKTTLAFVFTLAAFTVSAATTITTTNKYSYGANIGWIDWRGDTNNGAVIGEYVCSGYLYGANVGWIHLGSNAPLNGIRYQNNSATDYGVNHDGSGNLNGMAYGANIGWIVFTNQTATGPLSGADRPRVNLKTGKLSGYAYSANCGWVSLSNATAHVQTGTILAGTDSDADEMTDAWERENFGNLSPTAAGDADGDGVSNKNEYRAGTNPNAPLDYLRITDNDLLTPGVSVTLTWTSVTNRCYYVQETLSVQAPSWFDSGLGGVEPDGLSTTRVVTNTNTPMRFYRVEAFRPLTP